MVSEGSACIEEMDTSECPGIEPADPARVRLGDNVLSAKFVKELEHFYDKADMHDRAKCLQLITSVKKCEDLTKHMKKLQRPKTAMPAFGCSNSCMLDPYQTSYGSDYPYKTGGQIWAVRPMTSVGYVTSIPKSKPLGPTVYDVEYCRKFQRPASPERAATSSGQRNNKPHPPKSFLVWKFPSNTRSYQDTGNKQFEELTNEKLRQITKRLCHSVYQNDYLGIPQGFQVKSAFSLPTNWKENVPYGKNSTQRENYQLPQQLQELRVATTRYGSNVHKQTPAVAAIPTANKRLLDVNGRTTYDRHFNDNAGLVTEQIRNAIQQQNAETLRKICGFEEGQSHIGKLLEEFEEPEPPLSRNIQAVTESQPATQRSRWSSSVEKGHRPSSPAASYIAQEAQSAKSYRLIRPVTSTKFPYQATSPVSVPFTPPLFLS
ncbi:hypothetical protein BsWGS_17599 [Bradybaena similaris]